MDDLTYVETLTKTMSKIPLGIGIFHVEDPGDLKSIRYVFVNDLLLGEMRKSRDEVVGKFIHEVAPEAYESESGLFVIKTYRDVAVQGGSVNLGVVQYSNQDTAGLYECSIHNIQKNYVYIMLRNVTELDQSRRELAEMNEHLEQRVLERTNQLEQSQLKLAETNKGLEERVLERTLELKQKNEELEQFVYTASHDLQEPLRTISNYIQIIEEDFSHDLGEEVTKYLRTIGKSSDRMRELISALLEFSRLGHSGEFGEQNANSLVAQVLEDLNQHIQEVNARVYVDSLPPKIKVDSLKIRQLFQNLIANALKFRKDDQTPEIKIIYKELKDQHQFSISDNGIGIAPAHVDRIFQIFQRLHSNQSYKGYGLGLSYAKKIVEIHGGKIWVESEPGRGSTFHFTIAKR